MTEYIDFSRIDGLYSSEHRRIAQVIQDVFPSVHLIRMNETLPGWNPERPYGLWDRPARLDVPPYLIRTVAESEIDHRLLAELIKNNMHDANSEVSKIQLLEMAYQLTEAKREEEVLAEKRDMMKSMFKSQKHTYKHNGQTLRK